MPEVALPQRPPPRTFLERRAPCAGAMVWSARDRPADADGGEFSEPRNRIVVRRPHQTEAPARHEHPIGLQQREGAVKPVPRLRRHEHIDAAGRQRQCLRHCTEDRDAGDGGQELLAHFRQRLHRDDPRSGRSKGPGQLARASSQFDHDRPSCGMENVEKVTHRGGRVARPAVLETRGRGAKAVGDRMNWAPPGRRCTGGHELTGLHVSPGSCPRGTGTTRDRQRRTADEASPIAVLHYPPADDPRPAHGPTGHP